MNVTALMNSKLTESEIKRQKELNKLVRDQNATKLTTIAVAKASADLKLKLLELSKAQGRLAATTNASKTALSQKNRLMRSYGIQVNDTAIKTERAERANRRFARSFQELNGRILASRGALGGMVSNLRSYLSLGALIGAGAFLKGADTYTIIQNQLRGVTETSEQLESVTRGVFGIALRSRVPVKDLAVAYRRYDMALQQVGESQASTLRITETITKLLTLNGSTAAESASALLQLSQAFNKGKLDGDEFRTTAEVMPQVLDEITKALGISRSEIFKFSKDGKVTIGVLLEAFKGMEKEVDELMKKTDFTVGQSLTNLVTKIVWAFGKWNKATGFTRTLGDALRWVGDNLDTVLRFIEALVASGITLALGSISAAFATFVVATGGLGLIAPIIAGWVGAFTLLSDEITVTADKTITLRDAIYGLFRNLPKILNDLGASDGLAKILGLGKDFATSVGQLALDGFLYFMKELANAIVFVVAKIKSFVIAYKEVTSFARETAKAIVNLPQAIGNAIAPDAFPEVDLGQKFDLSVIFKLFGELLSYIKEEFTIGFVDALANIGNFVINIFEGMVNSIIVKINTLLERVKFLLSLYAMITPGADQSRLDSEAAGLTAIPLAKFDRFDSGAFAEKQREELSNAKLLREILERSSQIFENQYNEVKSGLDQMVIDYIESIREIKKIQEDVINQQNSQINQLQGLRDSGPNIFDRATQSLSDMKKQGEETGGALRSVFGNLSNALQNFVRTGKLDFKELMRSMLADLLKLFMNKLFQQLFQGIMGGGGGFLGSLFGGGMAGGGMISAAGGYGSGKTLLGSGST
jgi:tape measure domain-containing protein